MGEVWIFSGITHSIVFPAILGLLETGKELLNGPLSAFLISSFEQI